MTYKKKLIEVALPLEAINKEGRRDKSLNRRHPKSLHWWWARRPLAVCRAIIFAQLVDDPSAHPDRFPTEEDQEKERKRLFRLLEELVAWENSDNERVLSAARTEMEKSLGGEMPTLIDPFCGGGSIPVEARRLGLPTIGADLNPVAAMITKAMVEIPGPFEGEPPVRPKDGDSMSETESWPGSSGLAADVRYYGERLIAKAEEAVGHLYEPQGEVLDGETPLAWLWARTVRCPNPGCGGVIPLVNAFVLKPTRKTRKGEEPVVWAKPVAAEDGESVRFEIAEGGTPTPGTVSGDTVSCLLCEGPPTDVGRVKNEGSAGRMGNQLVAIAATGAGGRGFRTHHLVIGPQATPEDGFLTEELPKKALGFRVQPYGFRSWNFFYTSRQLDLLRSLLEALPGVSADSISHGASDERARAIRVYLAFLIDRIANRNSAQSFWDPSRGNVQGATSTNYMPMRWAFAEANPLAGASGSASGQLDFLVAAIQSLPSGPQATGQQLDAMEIDWPEGSVFSTDPPYYASIPFADLSDFYYVLMKRALRSDFPDMFSTVLTPKSSELVADAIRHGTEEDAAEFFRKGFQRAFDKMIAAARPDVPLVLYYALKQQEGEDAISGWEQMLQGLIDAGLQLTATWPTHTEQRGGLRTFNRNALASSIVIAARKRPEDARVATRREFRDALRAQLPDRLRELQQALIAPVDLAQASIGPGMGIFSGYSKVVEADGSRMSVGTAMSMIRQSLSEVLREKEDSYDKYTAWAVAWFELHGMGQGTYGDAEVLSKAMNVSISAMQEDGFVWAGGNKVSLVPREELPEGWDPTTDSRLTVWEITQYLIRSLFESEASAGEIAKKLGADYGERARDLAYRLFNVCEEKNWAKEAAAYNTLVVAWPEIVRLAAEAPGEVQEPLLEE